MQLHFLSELKPKRDRSFPGPEIVQDWATRSGILDVDRVQAGQDVLDNVQSGMLCSNHQHTISIARSVLQQQNYSCSAYRLHVHQVAPVFHRISKPLDPLSLTSAPS